MPLGTFECSAAPLRVLSLFKARVRRRRIASEREGRSSCRSAHSSTSFLKPPGRRIPVIGSWPVGGRPRFLRKTLIDFLQYSFYVKSNDEHEPFHRSHPSHGAVMAKDDHLPNLIRDAFPDESATTPTNLPTGDEKKKGSTTEPRSWPPGTTRRLGRAIADTSSAAQMPGSLWVTMGTRYIGSGGKSAARSNRRTCPAISSSSSGW